MEENKHKNELNAFAKKYVKEMKQEKPSFDFTASLMDKIVAELQQKNVYNSSPLISNKIWFLIACAFIAMLFIPFKESEKSMLEIPKIDFSFIDKIQIPNIFIDFSISNTTMYAILFFGFMVMIQVVFLKNHFEKRID